MSLPHRRALAVLVWPHAGEDEVAAVIASVADWDGLVDAALREGVGPLLAERLAAGSSAGAAGSGPSASESSICATLQDPAGSPQAGVAAAVGAHVPAAVLERLAHVRRDAARRAVSHASVLGRVASSLAAGGIRFVALKGPALSQTLYGDLSLRTFADLDLLVLPADVRAARSRLLAGGFRDSSPWAEQALSRGLPPDGELCLQAPDGRPFVDLHWSIFGGFGGPGFPVGRVLAGARSADVLGRAVLVPGARDQLLLSVLHGSRHYWDTLEARLAVALPARGVPAPEWETVVADAGRLGCRRRLASGVAVALETFAQPLPEPLRRELAADPVARGYIAFVRVRTRTPSALANPPLREHLAMTWWRARCEDRPAAAAAQLALRLLHPGPGDWAAVRLPPWLDCGYWLLRPLRLGLKYAAAMRRPG